MLNAVTYGHPLILNRHVADGTHLWQPAKIDLEHSLHSRFIKARQSSPGICGLKLSGGNVFLVAIVISVTAPVESCQFIIEVTCPPDAQTDRGLRQLLRRYCQF